MSYRLSKSYSEAVGPFEYEGFGLVEADLRAFLDTYNDWGKLIGHRAKDGYCEK